VIHTDALAIYISELVAPDRGFRQTQELSPLRVQISRPVLRIRFST
jgi:hypothetical protein